MKCKYEMTAAERDLRTYFKEHLHAPVPKKLLRRMRQEILVQFFRNEEQIIDQLAACLGTFQGIQVQRPDGGWYSLASGYAEIKRRLQARKPLE